MDRSHIAGAIHAEGRNRSLDQALIQSAQKISSTSGHVYLMFFNEGYLDFVKSWICNLRLVDREVIRTTLFVAASEVAAQDLQNFELGAHVHVRHYPKAEATTYGTYEYFRITLERLVVQNLLIKKGINVFIIEADATWFSPISKYLQSSLEQQIVSADDRGRGNPLISAGFLYYNAEDAQFFEDYVDQYSSHLDKFKDYVGRFDEIDPGEQHLMTRLLKARKKPITWLDECHFARGEWYTDANFRISCPHPKVLQNNYIEGSENKRQRAKTWGHWFLNGEGECIKKMPVPNPRLEYNPECVRALLSPSFADSKVAEIPQAIFDLFGLVQHVFVLVLETESCASIVVPNEFRGRFTCVAGEILDACLVSDSEKRTLVDYAEFNGLNHAFVHAYSASKQYTTIAVLEGDAVFEPVVFTPGEGEGLRALIQSENWSFIRVGMRPHFLETGLHPERCDVQCECLTTSEHGEGLCFMKNKGCDMRSADFYIASKRVYVEFASRLLDDTFHPTQRIANRLLGKPNIRLPGVDNNVFPSFESQWYLIPQLSYQSHLRDIQLGSEKVDESHTIEHQKIISSMFKHLCVKPGKLNTSDQMPGSWRHH